MHQSVLLKEVVEALAPASGGVYVDTNLGLGGHAEKILQQSAPDGRLVGFEWDADAMAMAQARLAPFGARAEFVASNFAAMPQCLKQLGIDKVDGILCDLGLSSYQLDNSLRGFTFKGSQPLDMRMDSREGQTAGDLLHNASEEELADMFFYFGEERQARRIASRIVQSRKSCRLETTDQLVTLIEQTIPKKFHPKKIHVATKVFQALRIAVNHELENLIELLKVAPKMLKNDAKFCVISFHSLEDRLVKRAFGDSLSLEIVTKRPIVASEEELTINPRARSAKLRVAKKVAGK
ncbi:MAG: 16S rRNA (cytosine(1402)-N(4))-methyltransferase RsmH [Desulfobulbaceae bacterium]|nr:16S rRNA (cytosine(1402)-N(4))-methyltransferase RsmH [Desulfobulbaceae bacterium]